MQLSEAYVFGTELDQYILTAVRRRSDVETSLSMQGISELIENITAYAEEQEELEAEKEESACQAEDNEDGDVVDDEVAEELHPLEKTTTMKKLINNTKQDDEKMKKIHKFQHYARHLVSSHVELIEENLSDDAIVLRLKGSKAMQTKGDPAKKTHAGFFTTQTCVGNRRASPNPGRRLCGTMETI